MGNAFARRDGAAGRGWQTLSQKGKKKFSYEVVHTASQEEVEIQEGVKLTIKLNSEGFVVISNSPKCSPNQRTTQPSVVESIKMESVSFQPSEARSHQLAEGLISDASICLLPKSETCSINSSYHKVGRRFGGPSIHPSSAAVTEGVYTPSKLKADVAVGCTQLDTTNPSDYNVCEHKLNTAVCSKCCTSDIEEPASKGRQLMGLHAATSSHYVHTISRKLAESSSTLSITSMSSMESEREKFLYSSLTLHET